MPNILIVDDEELNRTTYQLVLNDARIDANILLASNEIEAKRIIDEKDIDIVITDLVMLNDESGIDVLQAAQQKSELILVIIITAYEGKLDRYKAYEIGAFDCIDKSTMNFKTNLELVAKTKNALNFRRIALNAVKQQKDLDYLRRYFDPKVFRTIQKNPELLEPKSKTVTIVFWDIRGFSLLCDILKQYPTLLSGFLRDFFEFSSKVIFEHNGVVDKFIGDSVMAIFGALNGKDKEGREDAIAAVKAAIALKEEFEAIYQKWLPEWRLYAAQAINIGLGCGVHTGEALTGNLGTEFRDHFTSLGYTVNLAARIESESHKDDRNNFDSDKILISNTTKVRVESQFNTRFVRQISDIHNIPGIFDIFEVIY